MATTTAIEANLTTINVLSIYHCVKNICRIHKHQYTLVFKFAKNNILLRPEETMFVELAKAHINKEKYSVLEKTEHSSL